jgi:hypothetical protein
MFASGEAASKKARTRPPARIKGLGLNKGNIVPGVGNTDTVPAMLTPGEFVVNKESTKKNMGLLRAINGGEVGQFNKGGMIPGIQHLNGGGRVAIGSWIEAMAGITTRRKYDFDKFPIETLKPGMTAGRRTSGILPRNVEIYDPVSKKVIGQYDVNPTSAIEKRSLLNTLQVEKSKGFKEAYIRGIGEGFNKGGMIPGVQYLETGDEVFRMPSRQSQNLDPQFKPSSRISTSIQNPTEIDKLLKQLFIGYNISDKAKTMAGSVIESLQDKPNDLEAFVTEVKRLTSKRIEGKQSNINTASIKTAIINKKIVDFNNIPQELVNEFLKTIE